MFPQIAVNVLNSGYNTTELMKDKNLRLSIATVVQCSGEGEVTGSQLINYPAVNI